MRFHSYKLKMKHKTRSLIFAHWLIMGRSRKWPDLRSPISKIQDVHFVGTDDLIIFRKFHNFPLNTVAGARLGSFCKVWSPDLTWWPDLAWPRIETFTKVAKKMGDKVGENPAALRAAVFLLSAKNRMGGVQTPPPAGRRLKKLLRITPPETVAPYNGTFSRMGITVLHLAVFASARNTNRTSFF